MPTGQMGCGRYYCEDAGLDARRWRRGGSGTMAPDKATAARTTAQWRFERILFDGAGFKRRIGRFTGNSAGNMPVGGGVVPVHALSLCSGNGILGGQRAVGSVQWAGGLWDHGWLHWRDTARCDEAR